MGDCIRPSSPQPSINPRVSSVQPQHGARSDICSNIRWQPGGRLRDFLAVSGFPSIDHEPHGRAFHRVARVGRCGTNQRPAPNHPAGRRRPSQARTLRRPFENPEGTAPVPRERPDAHAPVGQQGVPRRRARVNPRHWTRHRWNRTLKIRLRRRLLESAQRSKAGARWV